MRNGVVLATDKSNEELKDSKVISIIREKSGEDFLTDRKEEIWLTIKYKIVKSWITKCIINLYINTYHSTLDSMVPLTTV